jgi:hypothetical protein
MGGGAEVKFHSFFCTRRRRRRMINFTPRFLYSRYSWNRKLGGPRAGLDELEEKLIYNPCRDSNPELPSP